MKTWVLLVLITMSEATIGVFVKLTDGRPDTGSDTDILRLSFRNGIADAGYAMGQQTAP
ncbi:hypothetical protein [Marinobacter sp. LV10R520-4]|uniref:hypothetical protein n=1 Tax=Marinobacter sp. LV10R520-4 TaxID=1761796 RepID=UPI001C54C185|nr:hypothetical protein [Marinobacter sp. LV10R520-4]